MADIAKVSLFGKDSAEATATAGAAAFTVPIGTKSDCRAVLLVNNRNTNVITRVVVKSGNGMRNVLGDLKVDIAASKMAAIPLTDTMRFKNTTLTTGQITVNLTDTADTALTATPLGLIDTLLIEG